jgi:probable rRNA maturation factor
MIKIEILADAKFPFDREAIRTHLEGVLAKHRLTQNIELALSVVVKRKMSELHLTHMKLAGPTDVLSFPLVDSNERSGFVGSPDGILRLGDIVICYSVAVEESLEKQIKLDEQLKFLAEHGLMHLLGYHHE